MKRLLTTSAMSLAILAAGFGAANADTSTATLDAKIVIQAGCTVNVEGGGLLDFGTVANLLSERTATADVTVACNTDPASPKDYKISLSAGNAGNMATAAASRKMKSGANEIAYNVYTDSGYGSVFGDATNSTSILSKPITSTTNDTWIIYGKVPSTTTNPAVGTYADNMTLTIEY